MEPWVLRAMQRWPDVPALFGWLGLDRRGRWLIRGEVITRPQIVETIDRNYAADIHGRWFFQNGPQRGYVTLERAPFILRAGGAGLLTHTGAAVRAPSAAFLDEEGSLLIATEHGAGALIDTDLDWALSRLRVGNRSVDEESLTHALALDSGESTDIELALGDRRIPVMRLDRTAAPDRLGFVPDPRPTAEPASAKPPDDP